MNFRKLIEDFKGDPGAYISLIIFIALVLGAAIVIANSSASAWREVYCQANPINCIRKGW